MKTLDIYLMVGKCKCGERLKVYHKIYPFVMTISYCPKREKEWFWNFKKHDEDTMLMFNKLVKIY